MSKPLFDPEAKFQTPDEFWDDMITNRKERTARMREVMANKPKGLAFVERMAKSLDEIASSRGLPDT